VVDSLEKKTLVERKRSDQDRRTVMVYLTELGRELIAKVFPRHAKAVTRELGFLTGEEKDALEKLLRKFK
jgi:MarR family 2-MHQ and catechol resistance regulon transcriptional repressor